MLRACSIALCSTRPPPTVPVTSSPAVTSILLPASCGVLPWAWTIVTQTNGTPLCESSASRSTNPCGVGIEEERGARRQEREVLLGSDGVCRCWNGSVCASLFDISKSDAAEQLFPRSGEAQLCGGGRRDVGECVLGGRPNGDGEH